METTSAPATENITVQAKPPETEKSHLWVGDHFSFHDILDAINPLQHIPIVSTIYRAVTGDTLGNASRVVGDGLYGGVIGVIAGLVDVSVLENTGKDIGGNVLEALGLDGSSSDSNSQSAQTPTASEPSPTSSNPPVPIPAAKPPAPAAAPVQPAAPVGIPLAQAQQPALMPLASQQPKLMALNSQPRAFAIDTSPEGILALHNTASSTPRPVPLNVPPGTLAPNAAAGLAPSQRIPLTGEEFAQRMNEGLDKYKAMMLQREAANGPAGSSFNQVQ